MRKRHNSRRIAVAVLASAFAVVAAPAQADSPPHGPSLGSAAEPTSVRPDDRAFRGPGPVPFAAAMRPDDRADRRLPDTGVDGIATDPIVIVSDDKGNVPLGVNYAPTAVVSASRRIDWGDAGIGAGGAVGLALLVAVLSVAGFRYWRSPAVS